MDTLRYLLHHVWETTMKIKYLTNRRFKKQIRKYPFTRGVFGGCYKGRNILFTAKPAQVLVIIKGFIKSVNNEEKKVN